MPITTSYFTCTCQWILVPESRHLPRYLWVLTCSALSSLCRRFHNLQADLTLSPCILHLPFTNEAHFSPLLRISPKAPKGMASQICLTRWKERLYRPHLMTLTYEAPRSHLRFCADYSRYSHNISCAILVDHSVLTVLLSLHCTNSFIGTLFPSMIPNELNLARAKDTWAKAPSTHASSSFSLFHVISTFGLLLKIPCK